MNASPNPSLTHIEPDKDCPYCRGAGVMDSGGFTPWDTAIEVRCLCTYPEDLRQEPTSC